jgi:dienelactone hydrolase
LAAAQWLAAQSFTPPGGVVLLGWSNGGSTVLASGRSAPDLPKGLLRGLVAFYPGCRDIVKHADWSPAAPLLILMGASDDWTPAAPCQALAAKWPGKITLVTYPGAYHDFDVPDRQVVTRAGLAFTAAGTGEAHAGTDPAGRADALQRVPAFLDSLSPAPH